jgi:dTDP-4-dehydrorhamnose 3,5-epimerase
MLMQIEKTKLPDVMILTPRRFADERGFFSETWNCARMADAGLDIDFVQDNHSISGNAGTLRGLHFQAPPHAQTKLVRCGRGRFFDVAVDIRRGSDTYGAWVGIELSAENGRQLLVPAGFAHGFVTREDNTEIVYKCSEFYNAAADGALRWDSCGVDWGLSSPPILSDKDAVARPLSEFDSPFTLDAAS